MQQIDHHLIQHISLPRCKLQSQLLVRMFNLLMQSDVFDFVEHQMHEAQNVLRSPASQLLSQCAHSLQKLAQLILTSKSAEQEVSTFVCHQHTCEALNFCQQMLLACDTCRDLLYEQMNSRRWNQIAISTRYLYGVCSSFKAILVWIQFTFSSAQSA